jgi:hypothetical protein
MVHYQKPMGEKILIRNDKRVAVEQKHLDMPSENNVNVELA